MLLLSHAGWLHSCETAGLDLALQLRPLASSTHVVLVSITDADYSTLFDASSPLNRDVLASLLTAVARGRPALIAVDLETEPLSMEVRVHGRGGIEWPPVFWALTGRVHEGVFHPSSDPTALETHFAAAVIPQDRDGVVRRYRRAFRLERGQIDSLPWRITRAFCERSPGAAPACPRLISEAVDDSDELLLNFTGDRFAFSRISASDVIAAAEGPGWQVAGPLRDKIVVIGGEYEASRDFHVTPVGTLAGLEVVGQAIESELQGGGIRVADEFLMLGLEILGGFMIAFFHHHFRVRTAMLLSLVGVPLIALGSSWLAFFSFSRWGNFVPVLLAVLVHELYEDAKKADELERTVRG
jgi:CHASE2 domain-containing sensor protein